MGWPRSLRSKGPRQALFGASLMVALALGLVLERRIVERQRTCRAVQQAHNDNDFRDLLFARPDQSIPPLPPALYRLTLDGDCYHAECDIEIQPGMNEDTPEPRVKSQCRGGTVLLTTTTWYVDGLMVPRALDALRVVVARNGQPIYDDDPSVRACARELCVVNALK